MKLLHGSLFITLLLGAYTRVLAAWGDSALRACLAGIGRSAGQAVSSSAAAVFAARDGKVHGIFASSFFLKAADWLVNIIPIALGKLYAHAPGVLRESLAFRFLTLLGRNLHVCIGGAMLIVLIAPHSYWNNLYSLMLMAGLLVLFYLAAMAGGKRLSMSGFGVYTALFALIVLISCVFSMHQGLSLRFAFFYLTVFLLLLLMVSAIETKEQLNVMVLIVLSGLFIATSYGSYQAVVGVPVLTYQVDINTSEGVPGRVYSFFDNPNNFCEIIVMLFPLYLSAFFNARGVKNRLYIFIMAVPAVVSLLATYMRLGWVGFAFSIFIFTLFKNWRLIPVFAVLLLAAIPFLPKSVYTRLISMFNLNDSSLLYRYRIWRNFSPLIKDTWLTGVGLGSNAVHSVLSKYPLVASEVPLHSHNVYIQLLVETGVFGLLAFLAAVLHNIKNALKSLRQKAGSIPADLRHTTAAALSGFLGILVIGLTEYIWYYPRVMVVFWFIFGVLTVCARLGKGYYMPSSTISSD